MSLLNWNQLIDKFKNIGDRMVDKTWHADSELSRQETYRALMAAQAQGYLNMVYSDPDHPDWDLARLTRPECRQARIRYNSLNFDVPRTGAAGEPSARYGIDTVGSYDKLLLSPFIDFAQLEIESLT